MYPRALKIGNNSSDICLFYKHLFSTIIFVGFFLLVYFLVPVHLFSTSTFVCYQYQYQYQYMRTLPVHAYILHSYQTQNSYMFIFNTYQQRINFKIMLILGLLLKGVHHEIYFNNLFLFKQ